MKERPKVGVGVFVIKDGRILFGKRKNSHGDGTWSLPGGHLEYNEQIEDCAKREVLEETGLIINNIRMGPFTNDIFDKESKHYVTLYVISDYQDGQLRTMEPDKSERWDWFDWNDLPQPLFLPIQNLLSQNFNPHK